MYSNNSEGYRLARTNKKKKKRKKKKEEEGATQQIGNGLDNKMSEE
jgi:hypothetical protein